MPKGCRHETLRFEPRSGTYYILCSHCDAKWMAVGPQDSPRHEALIQGYGVSEDRSSPFYVKPVLQSFQIPTALASLKTPEDTLETNIADAIELLYLRPQPELENRYEQEVMSKYYSKVVTKANKAALLADTRAFLRRVVATHTPR